MSLSAAVIDALVASGATVEQIVAVVKADIAETEQREARQIPWPRLRQMAFERDGHKCAWCADDKGPFEVDHIIARANGGENVLENVCVSCVSCNRAKRDRGGEEWEDLRRRRQKDRDRKRAERADKNGQSNYVLGSLGQKADNPAPNKSPPDPQKLTPTPPTHTGNAPAKADPFPRPEWADPQVWADLLTNRRKKNLPNTVSAHRKLLADIDKLTDADWPPGRVLEAAVGRGWGAIYSGCKDDDDGRQGTKRSMGRHQPADGLSSTARAGLAVFGRA